jgi:hypothetical protein
MAHGMQQHPRRTLTDQADHCGGPIVRDLLTSLQFAPQTGSSSAPVSMRQAACISHSRTALCPRQQRPVCLGAMVAVTLSVATERRCSKCDAVRCGAVQEALVLCTQRAHGDGRWEVNMDLVPDVCVEIIHELQASTRVYCTPSVD